MRITNIFIPKLIANDIKKLQADYRTLNPEERVDNGGWVVKHLGMLSSYSNNLRNFYWNNKNQSYETSFFCHPLWVWLKLVILWDVRFLDWFGSGCHQAFSTWLILLVIHLARHCLEEFNRIKGSYSSQKRILIFCQKMSCLALEGQRIAMIFLCCSWHGRTWSFRQLKGIIVLLHCSSSVWISPYNPRVLCLYLSTCKFAKMFLHPFWRKEVQSLPKGLDPPR